MPTLFISYKRGTAAVAPLMERLRKAYYRLWFDRDEIHLGDPDWRARIDQGVQLCHGLILNLTPAACDSEPVQYEVSKALELDKPIFPIVLAKIDDWGAALTKVGLTPDHHTEDFTDVEKWDAQVERLLRDLEKQGLRVTPHDRRHQRDRNNPNYVLHQTYLKRMVERVGTLNLAQINPENAHGVELERVYVDSPTPYAIGIKVENYRVVAWWVSQSSSERGFSSVRSAEPEVPERRYPDGWVDTAGLEALVSEIDERLQSKKAELQAQRDRGETVRRWEEEKDGVRDLAMPLSLNNIGAAVNRLIVLGAPGSGKSTFVRHLALCLAGSGSDDWTRAADITALDNWPHGPLTPVYVELRQFVTSRHFPADVETPAIADHLWAYIQDELGDDLRDYAADLRYDLEHGHAVLILDGLDEMPYPEGKLKARQQQLVSLAASLNTRYPTSRVIVASRPYAYEGWTLPGFAAVTITAFDNQHRIDLATRLYRAAGLDDDAARAKAQALDSQLEEIDPELKDRPLFVTLMATIYLKGDSEGLPTRRGTLYRESILLLLDRWTQGKRGAPSLVDILGEKSLDDLYDRLAALAYDVHHIYGDQPGTPEIDEGLLYRHLKPLGRGTAAELIPYLSENAGVLVSPGQDDEKDVFHFAHRTFQEYLVGAHLVQLCIEADSFALVRDHITSKPQVWRIPCMLAGDVLADTDRRGDLWGLMGELLEDDPPEAGDDAYWWLLWLAATISTEQKLHEQEKLHRRTEKPVRDALVEWLVAMVQTAEALDPVERAACGRALSLLGDPRPGVGVIVREDGLKLPDIDWMEIPDDGEWIYQKDKHPGLPAFQIARYPVTYVQFQCFADAPDYDNDRWWKDMPEEEEAYGRTYRTRELSEQRFKYANHPRERVAWYQAVAFCRWLSDKLGYEVTLPTEQQWEKAARSTDRREYPYEGAFDVAKNNTREARIGQTSALGIFPSGASPYGVLDMSGNVWEWCLNKYSTPEDLYVDGSGGSRVLRGGSWYSGYDRARAVYRFIFSPASRDLAIGFRLLCPPHLS